MSRYRDRGILLTRCALRAPLRLVIGKVFFLLSFLSLCFKWVKPITVPFPLLSIHVQFDRRGKGTVIGLTHLKQRER